MDGTKIHANASKHKAVSYKGAQERIAKAAEEVKELLKKAEDADSAPLAEGLTLPEEIGRREERKAALEAACEALEAEYQEAAAEAAKEQEAKKQGTGSGGGAQRAKPLEKYQYNFTDSESRIMKVGNGVHFEQSYNAQAVADTEGSMLLLGGYVTQQGNDKRELAPAVASVSGAVREPSTVAADTGYYSEEAVRAVERRDGAGVRQGPEVFCAVERTGHGRTVKDLEAEQEPAAGNGTEEQPPVKLSAKEQMGQKLKTARGKAVYKKRKETIEPVFGIIKRVMGFRQFMLRGLAKVNCEWVLVRVAYNVKRLHKLVGGIGLPRQAVFG